MEKHTLIIACGNSMRGDDGIGPAFGQIVQSWHVPAVGVLIVQQLAPELIEDMKDAADVLFVDAAVDTGGAPFKVDAVAPRKTPRTLGHHDTPANLLALLSDLEARTPEAWLLTIAAYSFDHGETLTPAATENMQAALAWLRPWLAMVARRSAS